MNKFLKFSISLIILLMSSLTAYAQQNETYSILLSTEENNFDPKKDKDIDNRRMPMRRTICYLSATTGVSISGYDNNFLSYEIWDAEGEICLGAFAEETAFISYLFSIEGEYQLRFITEEYSLVGNIFIY